jgi:3-methyladenine DNA glycosylase/8-oxoguanine DNA glycosylase
MELKLVKSVEIVPTAPFNFDATFHKPDHFTSGDNHWEPGIRWQSWNWPSYATHYAKATRVKKASEGKLGKCVGIKFVNKGTLNRPKVLIEIYYKNKLASEFTDSLISEIKYLYNFDLDLTEFYNMFSSDRVLKPVIKKWKGLRPGQPSSLYEYLIIGIVLQNATVRRSVQMFTALLTNYGTLLEYDSQKLYCFWTPGDLKNVSEQNLRDLKVGYRAKSIKKIDEHFGNGLIDEYQLRESDLETQKIKLLELYGVGPATVWYILFDVFHRWDVFEHVSPWEQKIYTKLFFNKDPEKPESVEKILKYINRYGKYKHLAVHYLWENLWWKRKNENIPWLEKLIRI